MKIKYIMFSLFIILLITNCSKNKYEIGNQLYKKGKYTVAIDYYDKFINQEQRGSEVTQAELERGDCYFQLGLKALNKDNWDLAIKLFYLSNSEIADELIDNCYFELAKIAIQNSEIDKALSNYEYILENLETSELIPEILFKRISFFLDSGKKFFAYDDYNTLCQKYPEDDYTYQAQLLIDEYMLFYIEDAVNYQKTEHYNISLDKLLYLEKNPSKFNDKIRIEISDLYILLAENKMKAHNYIDSKKYMEKSLEWDISRKPYVEQQLNKVVDLFIEKGDALVKEEKIEEAIENYRQVFDIIPDDLKTKNAIARAINIKRDFEEADRLMQKAQSLEKEKRYATALQYYKQSYNLHKTSEASEQIQLMQNLVEAEQNPIAFAKRIIFAYKQGKIVNKIKAIKKNLSQIYGSDMKPSNWKVQYSVGKYNYEVRYDIITPEENYYYVWRVNLENKSVSPLNKLTEDILDDKDN